MFNLSFPLFILSYSEKTGTTTEILSNYQAYDSVEEVQLIQEEPIHIIEETQVPTEEVIVERHSSYI